MTEPDQQYGSEKPFTKTRFIFNNLTFFGKAFSTTLKLSSRAKTKQSGQNLAHVKNYYS